MLEGTINKNKEEIKEEIFDYFKKLNIEEKDEFAWELYYFFVQPSKPIKDKNKEILLKIKNVSRDTADKWLKSLREIIKIERSNINENITKIKNTEDKNLNNISQSKDAKYLVEAKKSEKNDLEITEKDSQWLEDRFGIEVYDGGAIGTGDTPPQKIHDNMSGVTIDFRENAWVEASRKAGPNTPFTFIYDYHGRIEELFGKYLVAVAGWTQSGISNGDRTGIVAVNIKYAKSLPPQTEEWLLKKAVEEYERNFNNNRNARIRYSKEFERLEIFGDDKKIKFDPSQIKGYTLHYQED